MDRNARITSSGGLEELAHSHLDDQSPDDQLLQRHMSVRRTSTLFVACRALRALVMSVCKRVLHDHHAAEDAFQSTFLALVRQADSLEKTGPLASWLYTVAFRAAQKLKIGAARRRAKEKQVEQMSAPQVSNDALWQEIRPLLDEEMNRLQEKYRSVLVLVYLEGKTHQEVASVLGWPTGSVSRRIARARDLLRGRLARRGIVLSTGLLVVMLSRAAARTAVSSNLVASTVKAASVGLSYLKQSPKNSLVSAAFMSADSGSFFTKVTRVFRLPRMHTATKLLLGLMLFATVGTGAAMVARKSRTDFEPAVPTSGSFGPSACHSASSGGDATDIANGWQALQTLQGDFGSILALAWAAPDKTLVAARNPALPDSMSVWEASAGQPNRLLFERAGSVSTVAFSPDARLAAVASSNQEIELWRVPAATKRTIRTGHAGEVRALAFSPDGTLLASGNSDRSITLWDVATGRQKAVLDARTGEVATLVFSPDGLSLASGTSAGHVQLWDHAAGKQRAAASGHAGATNALTFAPDGITLLSAGEDGTLKTWDLSLKNRLAWTGHADPVYCAAIARDGKILLSGSKDSSLRVWDPATGRQLATLPDGHTDAVHIAVFNSTGTRLATGSSDHTVKIWHRRPAPRERRMP